MHKCMNLVLFDLGGIIKKIYNAPFPSCDSFSWSEHPLKDMLKLPSSRCQRHRFWHTFLLTF